MKSKTGIIFISIVTAVLFIVLMLLINHLICRDGDAPSALLAIDSKVYYIYNSVTDWLDKAFDYIKYVFMKASAKQTPEYPGDHLPLYAGSRVLEYTFNESTNTVNILCGTNDSFDSIISSYFELFSEKTELSYFKEYIINDKYTSYGMIGNFVFLLEVEPSQNDKYHFVIKTDLHYLTGNELEQENFFRLLGGVNSYLYTTPYIYMYQIPGDTEYIYFQLRDYKSRLLSIETYVKLYIDENLYDIRYYGDTVRVPVSAFNEMRNVKMVSYDSSGCIRAFDIMEKTLVYDAKGKIDYYDLASYYNSCQNLYIINTQDINDISYLIYFTRVRSLYIQGSEKTENYSTILSLTSLEKLFLKGISGDIIHNLNVLGNLKVLEISDYSDEIQLGNYFINTSCAEIALDNCPNLYFSDNGLFSVKLERLSVKSNYSLKING